MSAAVRYRTRWWITEHARRRWCERCRTELDPVADAGAVMRELSALSLDAIDTGSTTPDGRCVFVHIDYPEVVFVVEPANTRTLPALLTVVPALPHTRDDPRARSGRAWRRRMEREHRDE